MAYLLRMQLILPLVRHIMCVLYHVSHEHIRIEHSILLGQHASRDSEKGTKESEVKEDSTVWSDLEMDNHVWIENGRQKQDSSERASDERHETARYLVSIEPSGQLCRRDIPNYDCDFLVRELADVQARGGI